MVEGQLTDRVIKVCHVEDNPGDARLVRELLDDAQRQGFIHTHHQITRVSSFAEAVKTLGAERYDVILLDLTLPDSSELETVVQMVTAAPGIPIVIMSGLNDEVLALQAVQAGAQDYLLKDHFDGYIIGRAIQYAMERKRIEDVLRESKDRLDLAVSGSNGGLWNIPINSISMSGAIPDEIYLSPTLKSFIGFEDGELPNTFWAWFSRIDKDDQVNLLKTVEEQVRTRTGLIEGKYRIFHKDGSLRWIHTRCKIFSDGSGNIKQVAGISWDITEQKENEVERETLFEQVRSGRERLRDLAKQVVFAQEEERRRISRELHDDAGQSLTVLTICLKLIFNDLVDAPEDLLKRLSEAIQLSDSTMALIRNLAQDLRPSALDMLGLNAAMEGYCQTFARRTQIMVSYSGCEVTVISDSVMISLYRFLQEALTNAAKHSFANNIWVRFEDNKKSLTLSIQDNGRGFPITEGSKPTQMYEGGIGLLGMRERMVMLGGKMEISNSLGEGVCVLACIPIEGEIIERRKNSDKHRNR